jgi:hypothetical protein
MFKINELYKIDGKPFRYDGKIRDQEYYQFTSIDNPDDVREIPIYIGDYLREIQRNKC